MQPTSGGRIRYAPGLDGLRGLAVAAVVLFHLGYLTGGYLGVDLFFVLSGFLITSLLLGEGAATGRIDLVAFWGRRARRLLPALAVLLIGVVAYARFLADPNGLRQIRGDALATLFYVANWRDIYAGTDYWALFTTSSPLSHTWSLAIEEQFYLLWPLVFLGAVAWTKRRHRTLEGPVGTVAPGPDPEAARRLLARTVVGIAVVLGVLSLVWATVLYRISGWDRVYYGSDTRAFAILVGATGAALPVWLGPIERRRTGQLLQGTAIVAGLGLAIAWWSMTGEGGVVAHGGLALCSLAAGLLVVAAAQPAESPLIRVLSWTPLRWLGLISYGVYLYHWPVIVIVDEDRTGWDGAALAVVQVAITLAVACASYFLIERPIRFGTRWRRPALAWTVPPAMVAIALLVVASTTGAPPTVNKVTSGKIARLTSRADARGGPRIMVIGNSVAFYLGGDGFRKLHTDPELTTLNLGQIGCTEPPPDAIRQPGHAPTKRLIGPCDDDRWKSAAATFRPTYVIFARNALGGVDYLKDGRWLTPCSADFRRWEAERFATFADEFAAVGTKLVLLTSAPDGLALWADRNDPKATERYLRGAACGNQVLWAAAKAHPDVIQVVDLAKDICPDPAECFTPTIDGVKIRPDGTHYKGRGAQLVAKAILHRLGIEATVPTGP